MFTGMADGGRRGTQRDIDRELIEAWFQGTGATVVTVFFAVAALGLVVVVASDSLLFAAVLAAAFIGSFVVLRRGADQ